jgi:exonuclease III
MNMAGNDGAAADLGGSRGEARVVVKFLTWNSGGMRKGTGQRAGDWLLGLLGKDEGVAAVGIQESHCLEDADLCQAVVDMRARYTVIHSPAAEGDTYAGVCLVL